jgi:hypothetical protein
MKTEYLYQFKKRQKVFILDNSEIADEIRDEIAFGEIAKKEDCDEDRIILLNCWDLREYKKRGKKK